MKISNFDWGSTPVLIFSIVLLRLFFFFTAFDILSSDDDRYFAFAFGFALRDVSVEVGPVFVFLQDCGWCIDIDDECFLFVSCFDGYGYWSSGYV